jgi:hypothetical protein
MMARAVVSRRSANENWHTRRHSTVCEIDHVQKWIRFVVDALGKAQQQNAVHEHIPLHTLHAHSRITRTVVRCRQCHVTKMALCVCFR